MATIAIPQNDGGFNLQFTITDATSSAFNLTNYTVMLKVWEPTIPGTLLVNGTCVVTNTTGGVCTYQVATTDFSTAARYHGELELTKTGVRESTENFRVTIIESG